MRVYLVLVLKVSEASWARVTRVFYSLPSMNMSATSDAAAPSSHLQPILSAALTNYSKQTGKDLQNDPLSTEIQRCKTPDDILNVFMKQAEKLDKYKSDDSRMMKYLNYIVNGLHALSTNAALSAGVSLVSLILLFPYSCILTVIIGFSARTSNIFWYQCPSLCAYTSCHVQSLPYDASHHQAAKGVKDGQDTLIDVFECLENFLMRLTSYSRSEIEPTPAMAEILVKILTEFLSVLSLATKWMNEGRMSKFVFSNNYFGPSRYREICKEITRRQ
jgi:hypothetical protein